MVPSHLINQLLGKDTSHLAAVAGTTYLLHQDALSPLDSLRKKAHQDLGIELKIASAHRTFERQLTIWNEKAQGLRPIWGEDGLLMAPEFFLSLSDEQKLALIMRYSAIPGFSRHHWGSDLDIYDGRFLSSQQVQLTKEEWSASGPCAELGDWLTTNSTHFQFSRPYQEEKNRGKVAPEPWHISYLPVAWQYEQHMTLELFYDEIKKTPIALSHRLIDHYQAIYHDYISCYFSSK